MSFFSLIILTVYAKSTNCEVPYCVIFSILYILPLRVRYSPVTLQAVVAPPKSIMDSRYEHKADISFKYQFEVHLNFDFWKPGSVGVRP